MTPMVNSKWFGYSFLAFGLLIGQIYLISNSLNPYSLIYLSLISGCLGVFSVVLTAQGNIWMYSFRCNIPHLEFSTPIRSFILAHQGCSGVFFGGTHGREIWMYLGRAGNYLYHPLLPAAFLRRDSHQCLLFPDDGLWCVCLA